MELINKEKLIEIIKKTRIYPFFKKHLYQTKQKDYKQKFLVDEDANNYISQLLLSNEPVVISRLGSVELKLLKSYIMENKYKDKHKNNIKQNAGFFPIDDKNIDDFCELYLKILPDIDLLGISFIPFENYMANNYSQNAKLTKLKNLEPYFFDEPWSQHLVNKKVLVVHPFVESIREQFLIREKLFSDPKVLPRFELKTLASAQTLDGGNGEYGSWFEAFEVMKKEIKKIDFDIAIIGAGVYGLPLASFIKSLGKKAIHLGGSTQILFGVYGRRWEILPEFTNIINKNWIRPSNKEKPKNAQKVENACYW